MMSSGRANHLTSFTDVTRPYLKSKQKNIFILIATDSIRRYSMAKAVRLARSLKTIQFLQEMIDQYGPPQTIQISCQVNVKNLL